MKFDEGKLYFIDGITPSDDGEMFVARLLSQENDRLENQVYYIWLRSEQVHRDLVKYYSREGIFEHILGSENGLHDGMFIRLRKKYDEKTFAYSDKVALNEDDYKIEKQDSEPAHESIKEGLSSNLQLSVKKSSRDPHLYCFNVDQGDMSVFISSENHAYIIDTHIYSPCKKNNSVKNCHLCFLCQKILLANIIGDRPVEALILTHRHLDHYLGADWLFDCFKINNLIVNNSFVHGRQPIQTDGLFRKAQKQKTEIITLSRNDSFNDGQTLFNFEIPIKSNANENKNSIVLNITYKDQLYCLTGDADVRDLEKISYGNFKNVVLKVSHHGSITGTSLSFLDKFDHCKNKKAFISVGKNNHYHHPNALCGFWLNGKNFDVTASTIIEKYKQY